MIVQRFVKWCETATAQQRCEGVAILARAFVEGRVPRNEQAEARAALFIALDDASPKVRLALAKALSRSAESPREIILTLTDDIEEIAVEIASFSPILADGDLVDLVAVGGDRLQAAIARRVDISRKLSAAIAEVGCPAACEALLDNPGALIARISLKRMAERHGENDRLRASLLERHDIGADIRQMLLLYLARAFSQMPLLRETAGEQRADRLVSEACERGTAELAAAADPEDIAPLVEHLRLSGQLSTAFLIRMVCAGHIDVFAAALVSLTGMSDRRVRAIVVDGREPAFNALIAACDLPPAAAPLLRMAIQLWKQAIGARQVADTQTPGAGVLSRLIDIFHTRRDEPGFEATLVMLGRLEADTARDTARRSALRLAAA